MDQEHLTLEEQNQLQQDFFPTTQGEKNGQTGEEVERKTLETNLEEREAVFQQKQQEGAKPQEAQEADGEISQAVGENVPPDPQKDFMGYMQWLGKTLHQQGLLHKKQQAESTVPEAEKLHSLYQQSVAAVKQKHHDFDQAADFIYDMRAKQLAALSSLYPEMADPNVIDTVIGNEVKKILQECVRKNHNPAEVIYSIAKNVGYKTSQSHRAENLQDTHNSARTLAAYNGLTSSGPVSLEMIDKMSEAEFSVWISDPKNKTAFNSLMRGEHL
ncbi:hypothetical protein [Bartonella sp. cb54]|uniref:hypothetical protein n=1 Tax=Bartonella sp. cb54 TaxID=3385560 RepID=UPI0039A5CCB0